MSTIDRICELLTETQQKFLDSEKATEALVEFDADTDETYITQRSALST